MKKSKFSEEQIAYVLREVESGRPPADVCRQLGGSDATFYIRKRNNAYLRVAERHVLSVPRARPPPYRRVVHGRCWRRPVPNRARLNHCTVTQSAVTTIYDRYRYDKEKRAALEKWAEVLTGIVE